LSALLAAWLLPAFLKLGLPLAFDWRRLIVSYWMVLAAQSLFMAIILLFVQSPADVFRCFLQRVRKNYLLVFLIAAYFLVLIIFLSWPKAIVLTVDTIAVLEFKDRIAAGRKLRVLTALLATATYLFVGFVLVFAYNDIILSVRFFGASDAAFSRIDQWLCHGWTVSRMAAWAVNRCPDYLTTLEFIYFGMFTQIGAALILISTRQGWKNGVHFVGTILTAYYLALGLFYLWPSQGPYYLSGGVLPRGLMVSEIQRQSLANAAALWARKPIAFISTDYYIAFPCMHIAQPLVAIWFLRHSKRMVFLLAAYDILLVPAIVLLEWHYVADVLGGVLVAGLAIVVTNLECFRPRSAIQEAG
jgi:hypothetical protein